MELNYLAFRPRKEIVSLLRDFMAEKQLTCSAIARHVDIPQPTVFRALCPDKGRVNRTHLKLCVYAQLNPYIERNVNPGESDVLMSALREVWDGTEHHARALARLLRSVRDVQNRSRIMPYLTDWQARENSCVQPDSGNQA